MLFLIVTEDGPDGAEIRRTTRAAHLAYLKEAGSRLKFAGPVLGEDDTARGSVFVIEAASETAARLFVRNDPYARAGLPASWTIRPVRAVLGEWVTPAG